MCYYYNFSKNSQLYSSLEDDNSKNGYYNAIFHPVLVLHKAGSFLTFSVHIIEICRTG